MKRANGRPGAAIRADDKAEKSLRCRAGVTVVVCALLALSAARIAQLRRQTNEDISSFYENPSYRMDREIERFPLHRQAYRDSCGPATLSMLYSYLITPMSEQEYASKFGIPLGEGGMLPSRFFRTMKSSLLGFHVSCTVGVSDMVMLNSTYRRLQLGIPVPIYFATENEKEHSGFDTHYSVVVGIRPGRREVVIANAYGFRQTIQISDWLNSMKYYNYQDPPFDFLLGRFFGVIRTNYLFLIEHEAK